MLKETIEQELIKKHSNDKTYQDLCLDKYLGGEKIENYEQFWNSQKEKLRLFHETSESGEGVLQMHAELMNLLLNHLYSNAKTAYEKHYATEWSYPVCLIALGGYGRNQLAPYSDVNLMLLYADKIPPDVLDSFIHIFNQEIIYPLWNLKINVNSPFRTINNTIKHAKKNLEVKNAQLDARLICGSKNLFNIFQETYESYFRNEPPEVFINQIIEAKRLRHKKYQDTSFLQEPDIKFGVGGLRDYQIILWLTRAKHKIASLTTIEQYGLLNKNQIEQLTESYNFLTRVRNELQFQNDQATNILNVDQQSSVAWGLGYKIKDTFVRVNTFMKDYYKNVQCIYDIEEIFEDRLRNNNIYQKKSWFRQLIKYGSERKDTRSPEKQIDGFTIANKILTYKSQNVFKENPVRLVRVFKYVQQYNAEFSLELKLLIKNSLDLITENIINDDATNRCLCAILQTIGEVYPTLKLMHELGVLNHLLPEFKEITHLVQHEHYHQYTVDIHTLNTIRILDKIFERKDPELKFYYNTIQSTIEPWLIYLILLLHDLGKMQNVEDPFEYSTKLAKKILGRLKIDPTQQEYILFTIKNLFQMPLFSQKYDIDDPQVIGALGTFIADIERLNYLYVATYCDIKGTATNLWNSHKEALHLRLFENIQTFFSKNEAYIETRIKQRKDKYRQSIHQLHPEMSQQEISKILELYPDDYFILNNLQEIELHIHLLEQLKKDTEKSNCNGSLSPIVHWEHDIDKCVTRVTIVSWDRTGLLAKLAAAFYASQLNILNVLVFANADQVMIGTFLILEETGHFSTTEHSKITFQQNLHKVLVDNADLNPEIFAQRKVSKNLSIKTTPSQKVTKNTSYINVHYDNSIKRMIVEIHCEDQLGLLYKIVTILSKRGYNISFAKISTEHGTTIDTFYINKSNSDDAIATQELLLLREQFNEVLEIRD